MDSTVNPHPGVAGDERQGTEAMLDLKVREAFQGKKLQGAAIELANDHSTGATQVGARSFLDGLCCFSFAH